MRLNAEGFFCGVMLRVVPTPTNTKRLSTKKVIAEILINIVNILNEIYQMFDILDIMFF